MRDVLRVKQLDEKYNLNGALVSYSKIKGRTIKELKTEYQAEQSIKANPNGILALSTKGLAVYIANEKKFDTDIIKSDDKYYHIFSTDRGKIKNAFVIDINESEKLIYGYDYKAKRKNEMFIPYPNGVQAKWVEGYFANPKKYKSILFALEGKEEYKELKEKMFAIDKEISDKKSEELKSWIGNDDTYKNKQRAKKVPNYTI